jgi:hypothetical protein
MDDELVMMPPVPAREVVGAMMERSAKLRSAMGRSRI